MVMVISCNSEKTVIVEKTSSIDNTSLKELLRETCQLLINEYCNLKPGGPGPISKMLCKIPDFYFLQFSVLLCHK